MKFLADENIAQLVIQALKKAGFDIKNVRGSSDKEVIALDFK